MKNNFFNFLYRLLLTAVTVLVMTSIVSQHYLVPPLAVISGFACLAVALVAVRLVQIARDPGYRSHHDRGLLLDVSVEFWESVIARNLFKTYQWVMRAKNRSQNVNGAVVHIPQAGAKPNVRRNRTIYPIQVVKRSDSDLVYVIDELSSDTTVVHEAEKWELSYQKVPDVLQDHIQEIDRRGAQNALYRWLGKNPSTSALASGNIVRTTGANGGPLLTGATGTRKVFTIADVEEAKGTLIEQTKREINPGKRALILDENMYTDLLTDSLFDDDKAYKRIGAEFKDGDLIRLHGFDIVRTDVMPRFTNDATPVAKDPLDESVANAATDNNVAGLIDFDFVHVAKGDVKMFFKADDPDFQGDIMNAMARIGASRERSDDAGVVAIVQAPGT